MKGPYFQPSLSVCLRVCVSVCLWPALLPFNVNRFWQNLVTRTLLWSSLAATIMVQIGRRGTARRLFENFKKFSKITEFEFQNSGPSFLRLCFLCIVKKFDSIRTKLTEDIDFEICHSGNPRRSNGMRSLEAECSTSVQQCAAAVNEQHQRAAIDAWRAFRTGGIRNCWRSELGPQSGPWKPTGLFVCLSVGLLENLRKNLFMKSLEMVVNRTGNNWSSDDLEPYCAGKMSK